MGRSQKSKRITWASDLCQVRLFLSGESPSQVGFRTQEPKTSWSGQTGVNEPDDTLPPGFEGIHPANPQRIKLSQIPLAKWRCPPRFAINREWQVVAGDESSEREAENQRHLRVLEAIYPRPSAIPPNPIVVADVENSIADDRYTPVVPITPIEEEEDPAALDTSNPYEPHANRISAAVAQEPDIAKAVLTSVISNSSSTDQRNLIDSDLLVKILNNPKMVEQLITLQNSIPTTGAQKVAPSPPSVPYIPSDFRSQSKNNSFAPTEIAINRTDLHCAHPPRQEFAKPCGVTAAATAPFYQPQVRTGPFSTDVVSAPVTKDINYYKSLIQQHGQDRPEALPQFAHQSNQQPMATNQEHFNFMKSGESRQKITKPCVYYNSPKGCRNGANCAYQHSMLNQKRINDFAEVQNAKRVKFD